MDWSLKEWQDVSFVDFRCEQVTEIIWNGAPSTLEIVALSGNHITRMNWLNAPRQLTSVYLNWNMITKINWDHAPPNLTCIDLSDNPITEINFKNSPRTLIKVWGFQTQFKEYKSACKIQRAYLRYYTRRKVAALKITNGCHNWIWKPICKDGTIGIRPRLDLSFLGIPPS